jgi:hypothetical protein
METQEFDRLNESEDSGLLYNSVWIDHDHKTEVQYCDTETECFLSQSSVLENTLCHLNVNNVFYNSKIQVYF